MSDIIAIRALINTSREALRQDEQTPEDKRLSLRVLLAEAVPMLEQLAVAEERAAEDRRLSYARNQWRAGQGAKRKYGYS